MKKRMLWLSVFVVMLLSLAAPAMAEGSQPPGEPPTHSTPPPEVLGGRVVHGAPDPTVLPFTGADFAGYLIIGVGMIALGGTVLLATRKQPEIA
jgi:hypothetical protein